MGGSLHQHDLVKLLSQFDGPRRLVAVHAHPDDETLFTGAALAAAVELGYHARVVCLTRGEASELAIPVAHASPAQLAAAARRRLRRLSAACDALGVADIDVECGWIDSAGATHPEAIHAADPTTLMDTIRRKLTAFGPAIVLTLGADGVTGHVDHIAVAAAVRQAVAALPAPKRPLTFAAAVPAMAVVRAHATLRGLSLDRVGSGGFRGAREETTHFIANGTCGDRKRAAMDRYQPGLGTADLATLTASWPRRGDTLLARASLDELERLGLSEAYRCV